MLLRWCCTQMGQALCCVQVVRQTGGAGVMSQSGWVWQAVHIAVRHANSSVGVALPFDHADAAHVRLNNVRGALPKVGKSVSLLHGADKTTSGVEKERLKQLGTGSFEATAINQNKSIEKRCGDCAMKFGTVRAQKPPLQATSPCPLSMPSRCHCPLHSKQCCHCAPEAVACHAHAP